MATTTNYSWTTPDDTSLVKDGAAAIRSLGTSIDTTTKALNPSTTLGDIEYRSSSANTNTRLGIGTTGQVLTVAGGVPSWATPAGGLNWAQISTTSLSAGSSSVTVTGIPARDYLMIFVDSVSTGFSGGAEFRVTLNGVSGANYQTWRAAVINPQSGYTVNGALNNNYANTSYIPMGQMSGTDTSVVQGYLSISGAKSTGNKIYNGISSGNGAGNQTQRGDFFAGIFDNGSAISSITIATSNGNGMDAGNLIIWGA